MLENKMIQGAIFGVITGLFSVVVNLFLLFSLSPRPLLFFDFAVILTLGFAPQNPQGLLYGLFIHILFSAFLGMVFSLLIPIMGKDYLWIKGGLYGLWVWFFIFVIIRLAGVEGLEIIPLSTGLWNALLSFLFGLGLVWSRVFLAEKQKKAATS